ncbi:MAG TPA: carbohydrate kinase family protein [Vicinamibacterales bacterium]|nr:carbohydrate kinase family protein [Vicinamibacterales bacterium]
MVSRTVAITELLTVGEAFEDLIFLDLPRLPRAGEEVKTNGFVATFGGGALISAVAARRLGVRCRVVSGLSDRAVGYLRAQGVGVRNLRRSGEPHAITAALSTATNRSFVTFNGVNDRLEDRLLRALAEERARHVHFAFFPRSCRHWEPVVHRLREAGITTSWDFGWNEALLDDRRFQHLLRALNYAFFNAQEAVLYSGRRTLDAAVTQWRRSPMPVVIKLGASGSRWVGGPTDLRAATRRARVVDTTGAGDAFNGAFLAARLRGLDPRMSLRLGNHVGTASTRCAGGLDGLPSLDELPAVFAPLSAPAMPTPRPARGLRRRTSALTS